ncbi:nose resistant to fluoxetine protein 6-like [Nymphalis io]|uniref:nose resistant to fluoxetine protein 6-like n=1 Tax=Inachis io TaxID=171585 RepID=UPI002169ABF6|nr:nose resistant to fluoxetine protein 6-like [Nymphalis io]
MNLTYRILFFVLLLHETYGVIYYLNASEYDRMPPLYKLDDYDSCLQKPSDVYCLLNFQLVSDEPNELLRIIEEYSEYAQSHYNHTNLRHGVCATKKCQSYIDNKASVSDQTLEGCLNQTFWNEYQLKTKIEHYSCHNLSDKHVEIDGADILTGFIILGVILLNVIGSLYDIYDTNKDKGMFTSFLLSFSIQRNWKSLTSTRRFSDPRLQRLKSLNGVRCVSAYGVIIVHCLFPYLIAVGNVHDLELSYSKPSLHVLFNATLMIQIFFIISGFFLAYKIEISEGKPLNWRMIPKGIFIRYVRLTPVYALIILLTATWFKFLGPAPLWEVTGNIMISDCRKRWWLNLLYMNNYVYNAQCLLHSWYLAADMQLCCFGFFLCVLLKNNRLRWKILTSLFLIGIMMPAVHTYIQDLYPIVIIWPSDASLFFKTDPTFNETYKMSHSNVASYVTGISLGYFVYWWQNKEIDTKKYANFRYIYWTMGPLIIALVMSGAVFYRQAEKEPLYIRVIYAALAKPTIAIFAAILIAGMIFKLESVYRKFFECNIWTIPSQLTYCVYLLHYFYLIIYTNMQTSLIHLTTFNMFVLSICITLASLITAVPLFLLVEAPFTGLTKLVKE